LVGDGFGEEGFSCSWDSVEDDSFGGSDTHFFVEFWVGEGEFDGFLEEGGRRERGGRVRLRLRGKRERESGVGRKGRWCW